MAVSEKLNRIGQQLDAFTQSSIGEIRKSLADLAAIPVVLKQCNDDAANLTLQDQPRIRDLRRRYEALVEPLIDRLENEANDRLSQLERRPTLADDVSQDELRQVGELLDNIRALRAGRTAPSDTLRLDERLQTLQSRALSAQRFAALQKEVNALWDRVRDEEGEKGEQVIPFAEEAFTKVTGALGAGQVWEQEQRDALMQLRDRAKQIYDDLRTRHEVTKTRDTGNEFVELLLDFTARVERNPNELVTYYPDATKGQAARAMEVSRALPVARRRMLELFWRPKIEEYVQAARERLDAHRPSDAQAELAKWKEIGGINDSRIGIEVPAEYKQKIEAMEEAIQPELDAYLKAQGLAGQARLQSDPVRAYKLWQDAQNTYRWLPALDELRQNIVPRAQAAAAEILDEIDNLLKNDNWSGISRRMVQAKSLIDMVPEVETELAERYEALNRLYSRVRPLDGSGGGMSYQAEMETLQSLQRDYPEYWQHWHKRQDRLAELQVRLDESKIQDELRRICQPGTPLETVEKATLDYTRRLSQTSDLSSTQRQALSGAVDKLTAWQGYARARDEMAKLDNRAGNTGDAWLVPDLYVVETGLQAAMGDMGAAAAARAAQLQQKLDRIRRNEPAARGALERAQRLVEGGSLRELDEALRLLRNAIDQPSSLRPDLIGAQQEAQRRLAEMLAEQIRELIRAHRGTFYEHLTRDELEGLQRRYERLEMRDGDGVLELLAEPREVVKAWDAQRGLPATSITSKDWERVSSAWERVRQLASVGEEVREFCERKAREAQKQSRIARARLAQPEEAEVIYASLCNDPLFQEDWEVWKLHGDACFELARRALRGEDTVEKGVDYLDRADKSLAKARGLASDIGDQTLVNQRQEEWQPWSIIGRAGTNIYKHLRTGATLTAEACRQARLAYDGATRQLEQSPKHTVEPRRVLRTLWDQGRYAAQARLEGQARRARSIFDRIDAQLGIVILFQEDDEAAQGLRVQELQDLVVRAGSELRQRIQQVTYDYSAQQFRRHDKTTPDANVLDRQLVMAKQLVNERDVTRGALERLQLQMTTLGGRGPALAISPQEEEKADDWLAELNQFQDALDNVEAQIQLGLRDTRGFENARYILRLKGGQVSATFLQIPAGFRDSDHPSYRSQVKSLEQAELRRQHQETLANEIRLLLLHERVTQLDDLPTQLEDPAEMRLVDQIRQDLQQQPPIYPIETALLKMRRMQMEESQDACGLQDDIEYDDPDTHRVYRSLTVIIPIVEAKVQQLVMLRGWLHRFRVTATEEDQDVHGIVDWEKQKLVILELSDLGELQQAYTLCQETAMGVKQSQLKQDGKTVWCLLKAKMALSSEEFERFLRQQTDASASSRERIRLYEVVQRADRQRQAMQAHYQAQFDACITTGSIIQQRRDQYPVVWLRFQTAYNKLMNLRGKSAVANTEEWRKFTQVAHEFYPIAPKYVEYQAALRRVEEKFEMTPPGLIRRDTTSRPG